MTLGRKAAVAAGASIALLATIYVAAAEYVRGASFVVQAAGMQGVARTVAEWHSDAVHERAERVPWRRGELPGRWYLPASGGGRPILLVPGVHAAGIDEPRLIGFARELAATGHPVLTAGLPDLVRYSITAHTTNMIEDAAAWLASRPELGGDGRIGMAGISFAGGLSIVAASRPGLRDRVAFVLSFGGHGDLPRTLRYLCTGVQPDGTTLPPHDYGVAIILLGVADRLVPAGQVDPLRDAILAFLSASHLDMVDKARAAVEFERARALAAALPEPARTLMEYVNTRDVTRLGPILLPHVSALAGDPSLSPARSAPPAGPVYLLHGEGDNVIPAVESTLLARDLRERGVVVHHLATPLITHAEVDRSRTAAEIWRLVTFWGKLLAE